MPGFVVVPIVEGEPRNPDGCRQTWLLTRFTTSLPPHVFVDRQCNPNVGGTPRLHLDPRRGGTRGVQLISLGVADQRGEHKLGLASEEEKSDKMYILRICSHQEMT